MTLIGAVALAVLLPLASAGALTAWLDSVGAGSYEAKLAEAGFTTMGDLTSLKEKQLKKLGLKMKERKRVLIALKDLEFHMDAESETVKPKPAAPGGRPSELSGGRASNLSPEVEKRVMEGLKKAQALHSAKKLREAAEVMQEVVDLDPENPNWRMNLGSLYHAGGQTSAALTEYGAALNAGASDDPKAVAQMLPQMGMLLRKAGHVDKAEELFEQLLAKYPGLADDNPPVALEHANILKAGGNHQAAKEKKAAAM